MSEQPTAQVSAERASAPAARRAADAQRGAGRLGAAGAGARVQGRRDRGRKSSSAAPARRRVDAIVDDLAKTFNAPRERIHADVVKLLALAGRQETAGALAVTDARHAARSARPARRADAPLSARLSLLLEPAGARPARRRTRHRDLGARVPRSGGARRVAGASLRRRAGGAARPRRHRQGRARGRALHQSDHLGGRAHAADLGRARRRRPRSRADFHPGQRARIRRPYRRLQRRFGAQARARRRSGASSACR